MENIKSYRIINEEEKEEIDRLASNSLITLKIDDSEQNAVILKKMDEFVEDFKCNDAEEIERHGYELGSLFGNLILKEHNWNWYYLNADNETYYCISSPKNKVCCICHNYFYSILTKSHSNNFLLLYNMIKKEYPKDWKFMVLS